MEPYRNVHGFLDECPWEYAPVPQRIWDDLERLPNNCWVAPSRSKAKKYIGTIIERILRRSPFEAIAITPTCADLRCVNPAHTCITWGTAISREG